MGGMEKKSLQSSWYVLKESSLITAYRNAKGNTHKEIERSKN
jgi:hypothetical protein